MSRRMMSSGLVILAVLMFEAAAYGQPVAKQSADKGTDNNTVEISEPTEAQVGSAAACELLGFYSCPDGLFNLYGNSGRGWFKWNGAWHDRELKYPTCTLVDGKHCVAFAVLPPAGGILNKVRYFHFRIDPDMNGKYPIYWQRVIAGGHFCDADKLFITRD